MSTSLRRFRQSGIDQFNKYLSDLKAGGTAPPPLWLLTDASHTELIEPETPVPDATFANRLAAAEYLDALFAKAELTNVDRDTGLWAWLSLRFLDQLCPPEAHGRRNPGEYSGGVFVRLIPDVADYQKYYRHLLFGPYLIFKAHRTPASAMSLLAAPVDTPGEVVGQVGAYQKLVSNPSVVEAATRLYYDATKASLKKGSSSKVKGAPRRFVRVLNQFDLTWDLNAMTADQIIQLLPNEFTRFLNTGDNNPGKKVKKSA